jgi:hypothetical protein
MDCEECFYLHVLVCYDVGDGMLLVYTLNSRGRATGYR